MENAAISRLKSGKKLCFICINHFAGAMLFDSQLIVGVELVAGLTFIK